mmetsp:Transcript_4417/g.12818  ORF Transcript_4417/g.12818 Transcript_4417/m.12818 type:complete len:290 (-) Transcript_4417:706-1575(-)
MSKKNLAAHWCLYSDHLMRRMMSLKGFWQKSSKASKGWTSCTSPSSVSALWKERGMRPCRVSVSSLWTAYLKINLRTDSTVTNAREAVVYWQPKSLPTRLKVRPARTVTRKSMTASLHDRCVRLPMPDFRRRFRGPPPAPECLSLSPPSSQLASSDELGTESSGEEVELLSSSESSYEPSPSSSPSASSSLKASSAGPLHHFQCSSGHSWRIHSMKASSVGMLSKKNESPMSRCISQARRRTASRASWRAARCTSTGSAHECAGPRQSSSPWRVRPGPEAAACASPRLG